MPCGASRRAKFGLPAGPALFPSLLLAVRQVFLHLLGQFKSPRVAPDEAHNISKNRSKRLNPHEVTAIFSLQKMFVSVCPDVHFFCHQALRALFLHLF